ncbi:MAG: signal recognition particle-docking protein FtsY [Elainellaceae cyanobacterium]
MAPFNWFKRNDKPAEQPKADASAADEPQPPSAADSTDPKADEGPGPASEQLDWAKAAYQMIQKRKADEAAAASEESVEESEPEAAVEAPAAEQKDAPVAATPAEATPAEAAAPEAATAPVKPDPQPEATPQAVAQDAPQDVVPASTAPQPTASPATAPPDEAESPSPISAKQGDASSTPAAAPPTEAAPEATSLPFWAQADAERQQRLEQLKATAIEDAEPETASEAASETTGEEAAPGVTFDDDFVWSAKVLAAQGRRPDDVSIEEITWLTKLRQGLGKTRRSLVNQLRSVVGQGPLNAEAVMEIESLLLQADVGVDATDYIIDAVQNKLKQEALPPDAAIAYLKEILRGILDQPYEDGYSPTFAPKKGDLNIWLLTGVNGAGKTTTIGKLAHLSRKSDYSCLIAAADTFRAAAVEQVKVWGARSGVEVVANPGKNTDPAAVVFDAIAAARSRQVEVLLVDTAGRLQNKKNLMDELSKIRRIINKKASDATVESLLVLDATLGQNGLQQAKVFSEAAQLSGVVLTKLDGTAKGGVALAVVQQLGLPIRFIGAGEGIEDLRPFSSYEFVEALLSG